VFESTDGGNDASYSPFENAGNEAGFGNKRETTAELPSLGH